MKIKKLVSVFLSAVVMLTMTAVFTVTASAAKFEEPEIVVVHEEEYSELTIACPFMKIIDFYEQKARTQSVDLYFCIEFGGYKYAVMFLNSSSDYIFDLKPPRIMNQLSLRHDFKMTMGKEGIFFHIGDGNPARAALKKSEECTFTYYMTGLNGKLYYGSMESMTVSLSGKKDISDLDIEAIDDHTYTGKSQKPAVTIKDGDYKLEKDVDYTVSYENNKRIGTASATVKGIGDYEGEKKLVFDITPAKPELKVKQSGGKLKFSWSEVEGADKYRLYYSENGGEYKLVKTFDENKTSAIFSFDTKNNSYKFKIRAYAEEDGEKIYGPYSKTLKCGKK